MAVHQQDIQSNLKLRLSEITKNKNYNSTLTKIIKDNKFGNISTLFEALINETKYNFKTDNFLNEVNIHLKMINFQMKDITNSKLKTLREIEENIFDSITLYCRKIHLLIEEQKSYKSSIVLNLTNKDNYENYSDLILNTIESIDLWYDKITNSINEVLQYNTSIIEIMKDIQPDVQPDVQPDIQAKLPKRKQVK